MSALAVSWIEFENFRSLKKARLELGPLTVLVGGNGTGKSSVLHALTRSPLMPFQREDASDLSIRLLPELRIGHREGSVVIGHRSSGAMEVLRLLLRLDLEKMRAPTTLQSAPMLDLVGSNMSNVMASLPRVRQQELSEKFCGLVPLYADVDTKPLGSGSHTLRFQDRWSKVWFPPTSVSDGTLLILAYLLLLYQEKEVDLVAIEEPERGLHPYLLGQLVRYLRALAKGEIGGRRVQVVAATHSAELLNHLNPDEVRFLSRSERDGSTKIETAPPDNADWRRAYSEYDSALGSMWLSGGLGGVPSP